MVIGRSLEGHCKSLAGHWRVIGRQLAGHWRIIGRSSAGHGGVIGKFVGGSSTAVCLVSRALELKSECSRFSFLDTVRLLLLLHGRPM